MAEKDTNKVRHAIIHNELGLHARSAAKIADIAQNSVGNVWIQKDDEKADAASILDILTLACAQETRIKIIVEDNRDLPILNDIADLVAGGFGE